VVEDDRASFTALRGILTHYGWEVDVAESLQAALPLLEAKPQVVVLDLMLPDGDGAAILSHIRAMSMSIRVVVTTGLSDSDRLEMLSKLKPDAVLYKPVLLPRLLAELSFPSCDPGSSSSGQKPA